MRILQICHKPPFPTSDGGSLAMAAITNGLLNEGHEVHLFSIYTDKHPKPSQGITKDGFSDEFHYINTAPTILGALGSLITNSSYNINRFDAPHVHEALKSCIEQNSFDIIHLESLFTCPYISTIKTISDAPIVYRSHNIEFHIWEQLASQELKRAKKWYLKTLSKQLKAYEYNIHKQVDAVASISKEDLKYHASLHSKTEYVPVGMNIKASSSKTSKTVFHIGSMNWQPNSDGITWFLDKVWPLVKLQHTDAHFHFGGKGMPDNFLSYDGKDGIRLHREVPNALAFMQSYHIMIIPLFAGSGIRIKAIEAMGLGKAIVSTNKGAEGIEHGEKIMSIANTPETFANAIIELLNSPDKSESLGTLALQEFKAQFDLKIASQRLISFYNTLLNK